MSLPTRRRAMAWLGACAVAAPLAPQALAMPTRDMVFRVHRSGSPIGWLNTTFVRAGDQVTVRTKLDLSVYAAFIRVFRYLHTSEEVWRGAKLLSLSADTNNDGKVYRVRTTPAPGGLQIEGPVATVTAPADSLTTNCSWNPAFVRQRMLIDCERGRYVPMTVQPLGDKTLKVMEASRTATGFRTTLPHAEGEIWYAANEWVHGLFRTKGETLVYERES